MRQRIGSNATDDRFLQCRVIRHKNYPDLQRCRDPLRARYDASLRADRASVHFLGDVGNVASRLEGLTKELDCTLIVSAATLAMSGFDRPQWRGTDVSIRGRGEGTLTVFPIQRLDDIVFAS